MRNEYEIRGDVTAIFLKRKDGSRLETLIDTADLARAMEFPWAWSAHWDKQTQSFYAEGKSYHSRVNGKDCKREHFSLHRWIMQPKPEYEVDHILHDTLDNRRCNLREVPKGANQQNYLGARRHNKSSGVRGVSWHKKTGKWRASFRLNHITYHVGLFDDLSKAAEAVKAARAKYMEYSLDAFDKNLPDLDDIKKPCFEGALWVTNTSGYRGLIFDKRIKKWAGRAQRKGIKISTRFYSNKEDAYKELCEKIKLLEARL